MTADVLARRLMAKFKKEGGGEAVLDYVIKLAYHAGKQEILNAWSKSVTRLSKPTRRKP